MRSSFYINICEIKGCGFIHFYAFTSTINREVRCERITLDVYDNTVLSTLFVAFVSLRYITRTVTDSSVYLRDTELHMSLAT